MVGIVEAKLASSGRTMPLPLPLPDIPMPRGYETPLGGRVGGARRVSLADIVDSVLQC